MTVRQSHDAPSWESIEGHLELNLKTSKRVLTMSTVMKDGPLNERQSVIRVPRETLRLNFNNIKTKVLTVSTFVQDGPSKVQRSVKVVRRVKLK